MQLLKKNLATAPFTGWTPDLNTIYICTDGTGKVYIPVSGTVSTMAYVYVKNTDLFNRILNSDGVSLGGVATGAYPVRIDFLTTMSPYAVKITTIDDVYLLTAMDSNDTGMYVTDLAYVVKKHTCHDSYARLLELNPVAAWAFDTRYTQNNTRYYIDSERLHKLTCDAAEIAYPSGWGTASPYAMRVPTIAEDITVEVNSGTSSVYFTYMVNVAIGGDGHLLSFGGVELAVVGGILEVTVGGNVFSTTQPVTSLSIAGQSTLAPSHMFFVICTTGSATVVMDDIVLGVFPIAYGSNVGLKGLDVLTIKQSTSIRQYSGLFIYNHPMIVENVICDPTTADTTSSVPAIKITGHNCTLYRVIHAAFKPGNSAEYIYVPTESQRAVCTLHMFGMTDSIIEYILVSDNVDGIVPTVVNIPQDQQITHDIWLLASQVVSIRVLTGSVGIRMSLIGEH